MRGSPGTAADASNEDDEDFAEGTARGSPVIAPPWSRGTLDDRTRASGRRSAAARLATGLGPDRCEDASPQVGERRQGLGRDLVAGARQFDVDGLLDPGRRGA